MIGDGTAETFNKISENMYIILLTKVDVCTIITFPKLVVTLLGGAYD